VGPFALLGLLQVGVGVGVIAEGVRRRRDAAARLHRMVRTQGTVVRLRRDESRDPDDGKPSVVYYPTVRFVGTDGDELEVERDWGSSWAPVEGSKVDVYFEPEAPRAAKIGSPDGGSPRMLFVIGAIFVVVGAAFALVG
jgi:hypothetical protein